ncbi:hypothetical protein POM88_040640 [Heracleum sosnowskyi]|uniref:Reverse transcriptase zinc-binding domain-containing protein n=1 Tax=Heracleum sosnowskyi TaxID=360622 RepID=A0AAD8HDB8_9APIA|nr:hypothetical protein POM88_040640 [Heracleum sosnowskyi]
MLKSTVFFRNCKQNLINWFDATYHIPHGSIAHQHITYKIGNGLHISLWFDLWWNGSCLALNQRDHVIAQFGLPANATVNTLISSGRWILPQPNLRHHHVQHRLSNWLKHFDNPVFNLNTQDAILWNGVPFKKLKIRHIWDSTRFKLPHVPWFSSVWHKLAISRYAHHQWILCWNRLPTLQRLASFGLVTIQHCYLCVGGLECSSHFFVSCIYSSFVLGLLAQKLRLPIQARSWIDLMLDLCTIPDPISKALALLVAQVYCYHLWRERNARAHGKGCLGPRKLFDGIIIDMENIDDELIISNVIYNLSGIEDFNSYHEIDSDESSDDERDNDDTDGSYSTSTNNDERDDISDETNIEGHIRTTRWFTT